MAENGKAAHSNMSETDRQIEIWKIKRFMKLLDNSKGNGTSMISLIMAPKDQIAIVQKRLNEELGTAQNIKSRVNRLSVLSAITSTIQRLKLYNKVPPNGLIIYVGTIVNDEGKEKKITFDFEPYKPINTSTYKCENRFYTEPLQELLESDATYGFIVMDGNGCLYATLSGSHREVLHKFTVDLPKKHGRGGQSAMRFARLRLEKRHNYVRKVAETSVQFFITNDKPNVAGLVLAGSADFKNELQNSDMFDPRLAGIVVAVVDTSYGGENGFNQAIELSADTLANVKFVQEKRLLSKFYEEISQDTGRWVSGVKDTLNCLEMGAVETLIVWDNLEITRFTLVNAAVDETVIKFLDPKQQKDSGHFQDPATGAKLDIKEDLPLIEWLANNYREHGCTLEFVTDRSQEGSQFVRGFGGIGAILRYTVDPAELEEPDEVLDDEDIWEDL